MRILDPVTLVSYFQAVDMSEIFPTNQNNAHWGRQCSCSPRCSIFPFDNNIVGACSAHQTCFNKRVANPTNPSSRLSSQLWHWSLMLIPTSLLGRCILFACWFLKNSEAFQSLFCSLTFWGASAQFKRTRSWTVARNWKGACYYRNKSALRVWSRIQNAV